MNVTDIIDQMSAGMARNRLEEALAEVIEAVKHTGKKGEVTLKISLKMNDALTVTASPVVKTTLPTTDLGATTFFVDGQNKLSRRDPRQRDLPLKEIDHRPKVVRDYNPNINLEEA